MPSERPRGYLEATVGNLVGLVFGFLLAQVVASGFQSLALLILLLPVGTVGGGGVVCIAALRLRARPGALLTGVLLVPLQVGVLLLSTQILVLPFSFVYLLAASPLLARLLAVCWLARRSRRQGRRSRGGGPPPAAGRPVMTAHRSRGYQGAPHPRDREGSRGSASSPWLS